MSSLACNCLARCRYKVRVESVTSLLPAQATRKQETVQTTQGFQSFGPCVLCGHHGLWMLGTPVLLKCAPQDSVAPRGLPGRVCMTGITLQRCGSSISCLTGITRDSVAPSLSTVVSPKVSRSSLSQVGPGLHAVA